MKKLSTWSKCYFIFQEHTLPASSSRSLTQALTNAQSPPVPREQDSFEPTTATIPYRSQTGIPDFGRLGLSRAHRQLYLLADGQHSVDVLAKLIGRTLSETLLLLNDLERLGLLRRA
jgi:hypothetical protein